LHNRITKQTKHKPKDVLLKHKRDDNTIVQSLL